MSLLLSIINLKPFISPTDIWKVDNLSADIYILHLTLQDFFFLVLVAERSGKEGSKSSNGCAGIFFQKNH